MRISYKESSGMEKMVLVKELKNFNREIIQNQGYKMETNKNCGCKNKPKNQNFYFVVRMLLKGRFCGA